MSRKETASIAWASNSSVSTFLSTLQSSIRCSVLLTKKEVEICSKLRNLIMYIMMWHYIRYEPYILVQDHLISFSKMTIYPRIDMERGTSSNIRGEKILIQSLLIYLNSFQVILFLYALCNIFGEEKNPQRPSYMTVFMYTLQSTEL